MSTTASITSHEVPTRQRPLLITVARAAEMLALSRSSIYQLIWTDQLVPIRIGRSVRFSIEHLERFVADRSDAQ
jgi:excisionase family DNA binding protein